MNHHHKKHHEASKGNGVENTSSEEGMPQQEVPQEAAHTEKSEMERLRDELAAANDKYLRTCAEYQNYRKRVSKDISTARYEGTFSAIQPFLQVFDHFFMAVCAAEKSENTGSIREGLNMILTEFNKALDELGIERIDADGKDFDPALHEAISNEASDSIEEGKVSRQWSCGYKLGERLMRPARVVVSSGPAKEAKTEDQAAGN
ncbi:MAG: nucleotide exchange factor GrpE [Lentisphaerae bacterium GWF2_45_14]|nr:MAG: nucleotide exchange factor GrpE [Lentisphaerae bacterium GWF2_45_14]